MPEANDPSGVSAGYTPQAEAAEFVRPTSAGVPAAFEVFYNDTGHPFWDSSINSNDDIDPFYALVRDDAASKAVISGPDYTADTGRPTILTPGLYALHFDLTVVAFHDSDNYSLTFATGDALAIDECLASRRKLLSYNGARVDLAVNLVVYLDSSYADGTTQWGNVRLWRHTGGAATPTIAQYTFTVAKIGD